MITTDSTFLILLLVFLGFTLMVVPTYLSYIEEKKKVRKRIFSAVGHMQSAVHLQTRHSIFRKRHPSLLEKQIMKYLKNKPKLEDKIRLKIYRAGLEGGFGFLFLIITLLSLVLSLILKENLPFTYWDTFLFLVFINFLFFLIAILFLEKRYKSKINQQLPLAIEIILRGIRSGSSVERTFMVVAKETPDPLRKEFSKIKQQIDFGVSFDDALRIISRHIDLYDFYFFVTALIIQRRGGGSLAEILENILTTIHRTNEIQKKIKVLSSESRVTSYILSSLPIFLWGVMHYLNPSYVQFFQNDPLGQTLFYIVCFLIFLGMFSMRFFIKIKI